MRCSRWAVPIAASLATLNLLGAHPAAGATPGNKTSFLAATSARARRGTPGEQLWVKRYNGTGNQNDAATALGVSPDRSTVFVTGQSVGSASFADYATVAYESSTGARLWVRRYNGPGNDDDEAFALGVSPDGSTVFVTGRSVGSTSSVDYATVAYEASTGKQLWVRRYNGPGNFSDAA